MIKTPASSNAATVRTIGYKAGQDWKETVRAWQRNYNKSRKPGSEMLREDGIVGDRTRAAMDRATGSKGQVDFKSNTSQPQARGMQRGTQQAVNAIKSKQELAADLLKKSRDRSLAANRNINYTKAGEKTETLYERMKGDKGWASKYRREQAANRKKPVPVSAAVSTDYQPRGQSHNRPVYKSETATAKNLRPWERAELEKKYTQSVVRSGPVKKAKTKRGFQSR